ncbi:protein kinase family protein [Rhodococcus triatomae]
MQTKTGSTAATPKAEVVARAPLPTVVRTVPPPGTPTRGGLVRPTRPSAAVPPSTWALVPGSLFANGRYRLLERCGGTADTAFWRAHDTVLARDVALTVIDVGGDDSADALFDRTMWLCRTRGDAVAVVLDMFERDGRAVVVAQWKQSHALGLVRVGRPTSAAAALDPLARTVADAHRDGAVVAVDHPNRVRVGSDGVAFLAFPGVPATATARGDVRGLGNALSELLTGIHHVGDARPLSPAALRPDVPEALSALVVGSVVSDAAAPVGQPVTGTAEQFVAGLAAVSPADGPSYAADPDDEDSASTSWPTWAPIVAGGALIAVLATIGWFVGVSLV